MLAEGDPDPLVGDGQRQVAPVDTRVHRERFGLAGVLDGVVDQVGQRLAHRGRVERDIGQVGRHLDPHVEPLLSEEVVERFDGVTDERLHGGRGDGVGLTAALDPGEIEHVVDQAGEALALAGDHPIIFPALALVGDPPHLERLREHPDE